MSWLAPNKRSFAQRQAPMFVLMGMMVVMFALQWMTPFQLQVAFMTIPADMMESWDKIRSGDFGIGEIWSFVTMLTYAFLHGSLEHLGNNLLFFWIFGALIHELLSWRWLLLTLVLTAFAAALTHNLMNPESWVPTLGASGVVSGFMGAYLGLSVRWSLPDPHIWPIARPIPPANLAIMALIFVAIDYHAIFRQVGGMTAYGAHVGGFTMGLFLTSFITPRPAAAHSKR